MIINELKQGSQRTRNRIYSLFNKEGKAFIRNLLIAEKELLEGFELSYASPELRRIVHKEKRGTATEEELQLLANSPKKYEGKTPTGLITDPATIRTVNSYINNLPLIDQDLKALGDKGLSQEVNDESVILGRDISYWNLHPDKFNESVFNYLFAKSGQAYLKEEIIKMFKLKVQEVEAPPTQLVFSSEDEASLLLTDYPYEDTNKESLIKHLAKLKTINGLSVVEYKASLKTLLDATIAEDGKFKFNIYSELCDILPQYNNRKTEYIVSLLLQYNYDDSTKVNSKIDLITLLAFYRKVEEKLW